MIRTLTPWLTALLISLMLSGCFTLPATPTVTPFSGSGTEVGKNDLKPGTQVRFFHATAPEEVQVQVRFVARQLGTVGFEATTGEVIRFDNVQNIQFIKADSNARMRMDSAKESLLIPAVLVCMAVGGCPIQ